MIIYLFFGDRKWKYVHLMHCFAHLEPYVWFTFRLCFYFLVCFMKYTLKTHHNKKRTRIYRKYATGMPLVESKCQHCLSKNQHSRKKSWNIFQTTETPNAVRFPSFMRHFLCLSVVFRRILHNIHPEQPNERTKQNNTMTMRTWCTFNIRSRFHCCLKGHYLWQKADMFLYK